MNQLLPMPIEMPMPCYFQLDLRASAWLRSKLKPVGFQSLLRMGLRCQKWLNKKKLEFSVLLIAQRRLHKPPTDSGLEMNG